jgi:hypothetical protein
MPWPRSGSGGRPGPPLPFHNPSFCDSFPSALALGSNSFLPVCRRFRRRWLALPQLHFPSTFPILPSKSAGPTCPFCSATNEAILACIRSLMTSSFLATRSRADSPWRYLASSCSALLWYQRACDLVSGQTSTGHLGHQCSHAPGRPILHLVFVLPQTSAGKMFRPLALNDHATCSLLASNARPAFFGHLLCDRATLLCR